MAWCSPCSVHSKSQVGNLHGGSLATQGSFEEVCVCVGGWGMGTKRKVYQAAVLGVLLYGSETWTKEEGCTMISMN